MSDSASGTGGLATETIRGSIASILAAFDVSNPDGILPAAEPSAPQNPTDPSDFAENLVAVGHLIQAIKSGNPISIASSALGVLNFAQGFSSALSDGAYNFGDSQAALSGLGSGGLAVAGGISSLIGAINRGDVAAALSSGIGVAKGAVSIAQGLVQSQITTATQTAMASYFVDGITPGEIDGLWAQVDSLNGTLGTLQQIGDGLAVLTSGIGAVEAFSHGDIFNGILNSVQAVLGILALIGEAIPYVGQIIMVIQVVEAIFGGLNSGSGRTDGGWVAGGSARLVPDGNGGLAAQLLTSDAGGGTTAQAVLQSYATALNNMVGNLRQNGFEDAALIPERLGTARDGYGVSLQWQNYYFWTLYDFGTDGQRKIHYFSGTPSGPGGGQGLDPSDPDYFTQEFTTTLMNDAMANGIGHQWEADTARLQVANGAGYHGQSALTHAQQTGRLAPASTNASETVKLVTLDLGGLLRDASNNEYIPVATRASGHGVLFDINNSGFANAMDWVSPRVGILGIERDRTGSLSTGNDLFNDMRFTADMRGLAALEEFDADGNHKLTSVDPVFSHLQIWRDYNQDGVQDDNEVSDLDDLGITELDYTNGTFTQNGVQH